MPPVPGSQRRRAARTTAFTLLTTLALVGSAGAEGACEATGRGYAEKHLSKERLPPLIVGDSTMIIAAPLLGKQGLQADARGCRQFSAGVGILDTRRRSGTLPRVSILALGANGAVSAGAIRRALAVVGPRRILGLVTPRQSSGSATNMRRAARKFPERVLLIDWEAHSGGHPGWFAGDGLHVSGSGALAFARLVRRRIAPVVDPPVRLLRLPRSPDTATACGLVRRSRQTLRVRIVRGQQRFTCKRAVQLARRSALRPPDGWDAYDVSQTRGGVWHDAYTQGNRRVVVATTLAQVKPAQARSRLPFANTLWLYATSRSVARTSSGSERATLVSEMPRKP